MMEPFEGREEERERRWSERELGGSIHGGAGGNRAIEPYLREQGVTDAYSEERRRWRSTMRRQSDGGGLPSSEHGGGGNGERWRAVPSARFSKEKRKGASELGSGMEAELGHGDLRWSARGPQGATRPMASACGRHAASVFCPGWPAVRTSGRERKEAALDRAVVARE
jgi:hypothetical protein